MTTLDILKAARALISDPAHWTQGGTACDSDGAWTRPGGYHAVAWSAAGAVFRVTAADDRYDAAYDVAIAELDRDCDLPFLHIEDFNDQVGHLALLAQFDRTIARLESEARS